MTIQVELDPETESAYKAEAARRGVDPAEVVREVVCRYRPEAVSEPKPMTVAEFHEMLEELQKGLEHLPHLPDSALTREGIYGDHP